VGDFPSGSWHSNPESGAVRGSRLFSRKQGRAGVPDKSGKWGILRPDPESGEFLIFLSGGKGKPTRTHEYIGVSHIGGVDFSSPFSTPPFFFEKGLTS
jgi:hypothetical protein